MSLQAAETYQEKDIYWDKHTKPYKSMLVKYLNKLHASNPECAIMDPGTVSMSQSKGTKTNPMFFVMCGKGSTLHNVFFSKSDIEKGNLAKTPKAISESIAIKQCSNKIKSTASVPSSVNIHQLMGKAYKAHANGNASILLDFDAKNKLGNTLEYQARCVIQPNGKTDLMSVKQK